MSAHAVPQKRRRSGFTLVEILVALAILGVVITFSLAIFFDRQKRLRRAAETITAYQIVTNEAEVWRHVDYGSLEPETVSEFVIDSDLYESLTDPESEVTIDQFDDGVRSVTLTLSWGPGEGRRNATMTIYRTNLQQGSLYPLDGSLF